jgi:phosphatidylglycerol:prolipoprotein diacylglycerol transferase
MHPVIVKIGWLSIYSFGFMLALSFLAGIYLSSVRAKKFGVDPQIVLDLSVYVIIAGVVGSRLLYVAFHLDEYRNLIDVFALWQGGATLYGGFALAFTVGYAFCKKRNTGFLLMGDILSPALALGIGLTRIGCFLSGCCYGKETELPWGVSFPPDSPAGGFARELAARGGLEAVRLHPSQLYDSVLALLTCALLLLLQGRLTKRGATFGLMLFAYGASRFVVDFFRVYETNMRLAGGFNLNQVMSAALVAAGSYLLFRSGGRSEGRAAKTAR